MKHAPALTEWLAALAEAFAGGTFAKLALTKPTAAADDLKSIEARPILVKRELKISVTYHHKTRDVVKNYTLPEATALLAKLLSGTFAAARLCTLEGDIHLAVTGKTGTLTRQPPTQTAVPNLAHDKPKQRPINSTGKAYLHALGLTDAQGNVLKSAQDKFRQINKYIEVLDGLIKQLPAQTTLRVADMGSGKGYLTFALYDHLVNTLKLNTAVTGVEYRADMVELCNNIAMVSGFTGLTFTQGSIQNYDCTGTHVVIALHACDTATDDALAKAIKAGAQLIVVAPCCHKQVRRELTAAATASNTNHPLHFMLQYGTYAEKMAEMVTDSLRSLILQASGYTTNLFEFIADAHTPKNVMIVATRRQKPLTAAEQTTLQTAITQAKTHFGLKTHHLQTLLS